MALINIDDRDTYNYHISGNSIQLFKEYQNRLKSDNSTNNIVHIYNGLFKIDVPIIECTGFDIESLIYIHFMHELKKIEIKHTTVSDVDSIDCLTYSVYAHTNNLKYLLYGFKNVVLSDIYDEFSNMIRTPGQYKLVTNSTNTDQLIVSVYIQVFGQ